jgi:hypothetical protein
MKASTNRYPPHPVPSLSGAFLLIGLLILVLAATL